MTNRVANYRDHCVLSGAFGRRVQVAIAAARPVSARFQAIALGVHLVKAGPEREPATQRSFERGQRRKGRGIVRVARAVSVDGIPQACSDGRLALEKFGGWRFAGKLTRFFFDSAKLGERLGSRAGKEESQDCE